MILQRLAPAPHRGPVIAAGAVPLALAALVIELRMRQWSLGPRFAVVALSAALILMLGWLAALEGSAPRAYHVVLLVAGLLLLAVALVLLAQALGASRSPGPGAIAWSMAAVAVAAVALARRANCAACTLIAALAGVIAVQAFVIAVFHPPELGTFRAVLLGLTLVLAAGVIRLRDRRRRHAVALVNAIGVVALALAATFNILGGSIESLLGGSAVLSDRAEGFGAATFGWKLYLLAVGFGLLAYAAADHEPGPAYLGVGVLVSFAVLSGIPSGSGGSLVGWPAFLLALGGLGLILGLRPSRPLPPEPPRSDRPPSLPLRAVEDER